jgi:putative nucleotide binding protein
MEDYAYVLDVLPDGRPDSKRRFRREPVVYGLGIEEFKIFDMEPVEGAAINIGDRCYIGKETEERTQIDHVRARVNFVELTHTAQSELAFVLDEIVKESEEKFIQFYNNAGPISRRYHSLELIPGLGKKTMNLIVSNRPYTTFKEMEEKIPNFRNPEKYISQRIENEIRETDQKYRLFVR